MFQQHQTLPRTVADDRIASLVEMLLELLDAVDFDDTKADAVCNILLPKLWQRSGLDVLAVHAAVSAAL